MVVGAVRVVATNHPVEKVGRAVKAVVVLLMGHLRVRSETWVVLCSCIILYC